jgi:hypothetical protein
LAGTYSATGGKPFHDTYRVLPPIDPQAPYAMEQLGERQALLFQAFQIDPLHPDAWKSLCLEMERAFVPAFSRAVSADKVRANDAYDSEFTTLTVGFKVGNPATSDAEARRRALNILGPPAYERAKVKAVKALESTMKKVVGRRLQHERVAAAELGGDPAAYLRQAFPAVAELMDRLQYHAFMCAAASAWLSGLRPASWRQPSCDATGRKWGQIGASGRTGVSPI